MAATVTSVSPDGKSLSPNVQSGNHPATENIEMPLIRRARRGRPSDVWVINEGVSFVYGFDHDRSALIMTVRPREAKRFGSPREAELWVNQYGKDLEFYRIFDTEELLGFGPRSSDLALMRVSERGSRGQAAQGG